MISLKLVQLYSSFLPDHSKCCLLYEMLQIFPCRDIREKAILVNNSNLWIGLFLVRKVWGGKNQALNLCLRSLGCKAKSLMRPGWRERLMPGASQLWRLWLLLYCRQQGAGTISQGRDPLSCNPRGLTTRREGGKELKIHGEKSKILHYSTVSTTFMIFDIPGAEHLRGALEEN